MHSPREKPLTEIGVLIDSSMEDFEKAIHPFNAGVVSSLVVSMTSIYNELSGRKEAILNSKSITLDEKEKSVKGLFAEMLKIEEKVTYLRKRQKDLIPRVFDTK